MVLMQHFGGAPPCVAVVVSTVGCIGLTGDTSFKVESVIGVGVAKSAAYDL